MNAKPWCLYLIVGSGAEAARGQQVPAHYAGCPTIPAIDSSERLPCSID